MIKILFEILLLIYIALAPVLIYMGHEINFDYNWILFIMQIINLLSQTIFTYNILDNIYPPILYSFESYEVSTCVNFTRVVIFIFMILTSLFSLFITAMYVINFEYSSGNYYLQLLQPSFFFATCFYFFNDAFSDFSGWSYTLYYQGLNHREIKFHWIPRTLTEEMNEIYEGEYYFGAM